MQTKSEKFISDFKINISSGVGVIIIKTLEPFRIEEALLNLALESQRQFYAWDMIEGWKKFNMSQLDEAPTGDNQTVAGVAALRKIKSDNIEGNSLMVMQWPQWAMKQMPAMIQLTAQLSRELPEGKKRLVIVVPPDYEIPTEIREMVMIMEFGVPDRTELAAIFDNCMDFVDEAKQPKFGEEERTMILNAAAGLTDIETETAFSRAMVMYKDDLPHVSANKFLSVVAEAKTEAVKRSDVLELMEAGSPDDIGGLEALKEWVALTGRCMTDEAVEAGVDRPKGIFIAGGAGTGKSASAKAIAGELKLPLIKFDISRVFSSLVGSSEQRIKQALNLIESMAPCVALVDEVDKVFNVNSGGGDSGVGQRVLGTMLTFMQESNAGVFWVVTANRVEGLPSELLRKGRLDETFCVSLPNEEERLAVLKIHLRKRKQDPDTIEDLNIAAEGSNGYVPAELEAAVKEAVKVAWVEDIEVTGELIKAQLANMKPLSVAFKEQFDAMDTWARNNARPASAHVTNNLGIDTSPRKRTRTSKSSRSLDA